MTERWKKFRIWAVILNCCMLLLGLAMIIWPGISALTVCILLGVICIAIGAVSLVRYFKLGLAGIFFRYDLMLSICSVLVGVLLLIHPSGAVAFLPVAIGIYLIMGSVFCIQLSVELKRFASGSWWIALSGGIVGALLAFLMLLDPFTGASVLMIMAGISLMVGGVQNLCVLSSITKAIKAGKNGRVIEADWTEAD